MKTKSIIFFFMAPHNTPHKFVSKVYMRELQSTQILHFFDKSMGDVQEAFFSCWAWYFNDGYAHGLKVFWNSFVIETLVFFVKVLLVLHERYFLTIHILSAFIHK